jgi:hypothetical protein
MKNKTIFKHRVCLLISVSSRLYKLTIGAVKKKNNEFTEEFQSTFNISEYGKTKQKTIPGKSG